MGGEGATGSDGEQMQGGTVENGPDFVYWDYDYF